MFPRGATNEQLIWRIGASGIRLSPSELLSGLNALSERGEIIRDNAGRWKSASRPNGPAVKQPGGGDLPDDGRRHVLRAAAAHWGTRAQTPPASDPQEPNGSSLPEWSKLASYFAATQRKDPRGRIKEFSDRHGAGWQLWWTSGPWWVESEIRIPMESLPAEFQEALSRRKTSAAAVGWPVSLFSTPEGPSFIPGLILPADFRQDGPDLRISLDPIDPIINPAWIDEVVRKTAWTEAALLDRLVPEGEPCDLGAVSDRMRHALATIGGACLRPASLEPELTIEGVGLRNAAALFLSDDASFTRGAAEDLEAMRAWTNEDLKATALGALLSEAKTATGDTPPVLQVSAGDILTDNQIEATQAALSGPLTVIQGPPGTGKSQVILNLIVSALVAGRTVLFAAKNHQAIDEVERRLKDLVPDAPLLIRARDAEGDRNSSFLDVHADLARGEALDQETRGTDELCQRLLDKGRALQALKTAEQDRTALEVELSDLVERLTLTGHQPPSPKSDDGGWLGRLSRWIGGLFRARRATSASLQANATTRQIIDRISTVRDQITSLSRDPTSTDQFDEALKALALEVREGLPALAKVITRPKRPDWHHLVRRSKELEFGRIKSVRRMPSEDARAVLRHRPAWAVSTLSAPARVPLIPGLFDYVIFDEASQCDIASALPLFGRARRAVVVGDPMQLKFVPSLGNASEHALMDAAGLPRAGRASIAQSTNSLFEFCDGRPSAQRLFLADQFRSAPPIVDYLNADFYAGRLTGRRAEESFRPPTGYRAGLTWEDVTGHAGQTEEGVTNRPEAQEIVRILKRLASDPDFSGSVGVLSPFNAQVGEIQKRLATELPPAAREKLSLRVSTIDKFQGGEADVILFSLVLCASAPRPSWTFLQRERRRLNVAISRARALCIIVGDLNYARDCGIRHIEFLAQRATTPWTPYRPQLFDSDWERRLDTAMRGRGLDPLSQFPVGSRYLDFALDPDGVKLNVEVDGRRWHTDSTGQRKVADRLRDAEMRSRGWKVLRFWVHELAYDMEDCLDRIERALGRR